MSLHPQIERQLNFHYSDRFLESIHISVECPICKNHWEMVIKLAEYYKYKQGAFIQDAFVSLDADSRDRLMTGFCGSCHKKVYESSEEDLETK